jgi:hypothetical protein
MELTDLPNELYTVIGFESRDFTLKAGSLKPTGKSISGIIWGIIWMGFFSLLFFGIFDLNLSESVALGAIENRLINPAFYLLAFFGIFYLIGLIIIINSVVPLIKRGGYFVGTPDRLIHYRKGNIRSINWEQFTGHMKVRGSDQKGTLSMELRTGRIKNQKGGRIFIPEIIFMTGIASVSDIEKLCLRRIKENSSNPDFEKSLQPNISWKILDYRKHSGL